MSVGRQSLVAVVVAITVAWPLRAVSSSVSTRTEACSIRGREQILHLYGPETGRPIVVASGDGGWLHLAPHAAEVLASRGYFVVGFDSRAYLESFTSGAESLQETDVPRDVDQLAMRAARPTGRRPILLGVSEGAGLFVLASSSPSVQAHVDGVITLGLPDRNELAWRWKDALIYVTHGVPDEPFFSAGQILGRVAPLPFGAIYSDHDEFVPDAERRQLVGAAMEPKRLWTVPSSNHRFSDNLPGCDRALAEALRWASAARG